MKFTCICLVCAHSRGDLGLPNRAPTNQRLLNRT